MKKSIGAKTIVFPTPVYIVATYNKSSKPNATAVAWGGICCSVPPCIAISLREATTTYGNIMERKAFTINIPSEKHIKEADYFGIVSGKNEDKFAVTGLTACKSDIVDAPYIKEFSLNLECQLINTIKIGLHTQFIGEIKDIKVDEDMLEKGVVPDIGKIKPFSFNPATRTYYGTGKYLAEAFSVGKR
ncbi:MAG: flavin reductase family protein [Candidatus Omnitrophota bacterium]|jgi:flavin reductase (DIM6/NTAB) family NADH-FMN oxidoreductase RutF